MPLVKSDKARQELASRQRVLSVRERSVLFLADGIRSRDELVYLLQGDIGMLQRLMQSGYLVASETLGAQGAQMTDFAVSQAVTRPVFAATVSPAPPITTIPQYAAGLPGLGEVDKMSGFVHALPQSVDNFEGKRSLATTRMFLFDIVERIFVRKMPELVNHLRDQLREARDRESMLATDREIIENAEEIAGPDRADGLSERLAMMLPPE